MAGAPFVRRRRPSLVDAIRSPIARTGLTTPELVGTCVIQTTAMEEGSRPRVVVLVEKRPFQHAVQDLQIDRPGAATASARGGGYSQHHPVVLVVPRPLAGRHDVGGVLRLAE